MAFFFLSGLRHITILKLLGVGEEIGGVLELFPINGMVVFFITVWTTVRFSEIIWNYMQAVDIPQGTGGKHKARGLNPALYLVLYSTAPCFYPAVVPSSHLTVKGSYIYTVLKLHSAL